MNIRKGISLLLLLWIAMLVGPGCATVQPWERDVLAKPEMSLDADAVTNGLDEHIYFSKESSSGGRGFGGGGCGCN
ncbi:MAG: DUF4266 domain-containing protein [Pseudomonadales bacterium]